MLPSDFATGASTFADTAPGTLYEARIFVPVRVAGVNVDVTAMVDTAAPWCVLEGALATLLVDQEATTAFSKEPALLWILLQTCSISGFYRRQGKSGVARGSIQ